MEVDSLTVFLAGGQQDSPVGELVSALVQMCPWHIPPLIHGCIVPDAWKWGEGKTKLGLRPHPRLLTCLAAGLIPHRQLEARTFHIENNNCGKEEEAEEEEICERQEEGQKKDTALGEGEGLG